MQQNLERLEAELTVVLSGLTAHDVQQTPRSDPAKWNVQQIVEHLLLSYRSTLALVEVRLGKGTPTQAKPSAAQRLWQFGLIRLGYFPSGGKAPAAVCPDLSAPWLTGTELSRQVHEDLAALADALDKAECIFGDQRFASHVILGPLSAPQWRKFHLIHGMHHIRQMRQILQESGT